MVINVDVRQDIEGLISEKTDLGNELFKNCFLIGYFGNRLGLHCYGFATQTRS